MSEAPMYLPQEVPFSFEKLRNSLEKIFPRLDKTLEAFAAGVPRS
jgi:hypothetical protein